MAKSKRYIVRKSDGKKLEVTSENKDAIKKKYMANKEAYDLITEGIPEVKKKDVPQATSTDTGVVQTPPSTSPPSLTGSEVWSQVSSKQQSPTAPSPIDVTSESDALNVQSPSGTQQESQVSIPSQEMTQLMPAGQTATSLIQESVKAPQKNIYSISDLQASAPDLPADTPLIDEFGQRIDLNLEGNKQSQIEQEKVINWQEKGGHQKIQNKYNQVEDFIKNNFTQEQILNGEHEEFATREMNKFLEDNKEDIPLSLYNRYTIDKDVLINSIKDANKKAVRKDRITKNIDNEAFKIEGLETEGFESMKRDYESGEVSNSDLLWNDFLWKNNPEKALELYTGLTGEEFTTGDNNQDALLQFNPQEKARLAVSEMRNNVAERKTNDLDRKIYDIAVATGNNEEEYYKIADAYKSDMVKNNIGWQPLSDKWNATKEYYRLFQKDDKNDADIEKMKQMAQVINQPSNAFYDVETGKWITEKNEISKIRSQSFDKIKNQIRSTYGNDAMGSLMRNIEKTSSEIEYLKPILEKQLSSTKVVSQDMPGQTVTQEVSYDQFSRPELQDRLKDLTANLNAMVEVLIENTNPSNNPEKNMFDTMFNTRDVKIQEHKRDLIRASAQVGNPLNEQDIDYLEDDFNAKLGNTIRESVPLGAEIMFDILVGGKAKGILGVNKLVNKLNKGNKFKKFLSKSIDKSYDILNQEVAFQSAGEGTGAGTGEYLVENLAEKIMPKGWNRFTRAAGRVLAGTVGETGAEYGGQLASNYIEDGDFSKALKETFAGGSEEFLLTLASSFIMTAPTAGLRGSDGDNISKEVNTGNILLTKKRLDETAEDSEIKEDFDRTVDEYYPEEVVKSQGKKLFTDGNVESYSDIVEKPVEEWTDDEVTFVNGMDGFYDSSKELLPKKQREKFERLKGRFDNRGKTKQDDKKDQERVSGEEQVRKEPVEKQPIKEASKEEAGASGVLQEEGSKRSGEEVVDETPSIANSEILEVETSKVKEGVAPMSQKKVFDALTDYTEQVANETGLKGKPLIEEVASRVESNENLDIAAEDVLAEEQELSNIINQKQLKDESKRVDASGVQVEGEKAVQSEERNELETKRKEDVESVQQTEGQERRSRSDETKVEGESSTKNTEGELETPPPTTEMGGTSVESKKKPKKKPTYKKGKVKIPTKIARRIAEGDLNEDKVMKLAEEAARETEDFKENSRVADSLVNEMGIDDAYAYVNSPDANVNNRVKSDVITAKYMDLRKKSEDKKYSKLKQEQFEKEANQLLFEISVSLADAARTLSYEGQLQKKYGLQGSEIDIVRKVKIEIEAKLAEKGVGGKTKQQQIDELKESITPKIKQALGGDASALLKENKELKAKVDALIAKMAENKTSKKERKATLDKELEDARNKLKKAWKGRSKGPAQGTLLPGLNTDVIEALGELIVAYTKSKIYNASQVINKVYNEAKSAGIKVDKEDLTNLAMEIKDYKDLNTQEQAIIQKEVVKKILGQKYDPKKSIEENIEGKNVVKLWEQYQNESVERVKNTINNLKKKAGKGDVALLDNLAKAIEANIKQKVKEIIPKARVAGGKKTSKINILSNLIKNQTDINSTLEKVLESIEDPNIKEYIENRLSDEVLVSNEALKGATEEFLKKELTADNLFNIISDAAQKGQSYTQAIRDRIVNQMGLTPSEAKSVTNLINDYIDLNYEDSIYNKVDKFLADKIRAKVDPKRIMELAEDYFLDAESAVMSLSEKIMADEGIDVSSREAKLIADKISKEVSSFVEGKLDSELNKFFKPKKELSETERALKKEQLKEKSKLISRVQKAIVLGQLNTQGFRNAFAEHFGFKEIDPQIMGAISDLYKKALDYRNQGKTELFRKTQVKINTLLESIKDKNKLKAVGELIQELDYTNILSGLNTQMNAAWGGSLGALINGVAFTLRNMTRPGSIAFGISKAFSKANIKASISEAAMAAKYNYTKTDMGDWVNMTANNANKQSTIQKKTLEGVRKYIKQNYKKDGSMSEKTKVVMRAIGNAFLQHTRLTFILKAQDAILRGAISEYVAAVKTYNDTVKEGNYTPVQSIFGGSKKLQNTMNKALGYDNYPEYKKQAKTELNEAYQEIVNDVDSEIRSGELSKNNREIEIDKRAEDLFGKNTFRSWKNKALKGQESDVYRGYISRRAKELMENDRTDEINEFSNKVASEWILMNEPEMGVGMLYSDAVKRASYIQDGDDLPRVLGKLAITNILKFPRMTGNTLNIFVSGIPVLGVLPTMYGFYRDPATGKRKIGRKSKANQEFVSQMLMVNAMTSVLAGFVFKEMFEWDDEEEDFKLDPNRLIDFTSVGYRNWGKNEQSHPDYQNFAVRFRTSADGDWSKWMKMQYAPQMMGMTAFLGRVTDDAKGMNKDKKLDEIEERGLFSGAGIKDYYVSTMESLMEGSFNSVGRSIKPYTYHPMEDWAAIAMEQFMLSPAKRLTQPSFYRDVMREYKTQAGFNVKEIKDESSFLKETLNRFASDFYFLDEVMLNDKVNAFGEKIKHTNSISSWFNTDQKDMSKYEKMIYSNARTHFKKISIPTKIEKGGIVMEITDEDLRAKMQDAARVRLRELIDPYFDQIEKMSRSNDKMVIDQFNDGMTKLSTKAKDQIYGEYYQKYKGTDKIKVKRK